MFSKQRNNYVLVERPSTSPTAATSTPSVPADDGKFCLETPTTNFYQYTYNFVQSFAVCNRNDDNSCDARLPNCVFFTQAQHQLSTAMITYQHWSSFWATYYVRTPSYRLAVTTFSAQVSCLQIFRLNWCKIFTKFVSHTAHNFCTRFHTLTLEGYIESDCYGLLSIFCTLSPLQ